MTKSFPPRRRSWPFILAGVMLLLFVVSIVLPAWYAQATGGDRIANSRKLQQLGSALEGYAKANGGRLPPAASLDGAGRPLLSWRVLILPYLKKNAKSNQPSPEAELYAQFKLDEPWDSAHNTALLKRMPEQFRWGKGEASDVTVTHFRVFEGPGAAFERGQTITMGDVADGPERTLAIVEANAAVPWTKPDELPFGPEVPLPDLGVAGSGFLGVSLYQGETRYYPSTYDREWLRAVITRAGGERRSLNEW